MPIPGGCWLSLWLLSAASAQEPLALSLEDALRLATATSESVALGEAAVQRASGIRLQVRSLALPQVNAEASLARAFASEFDDLVPETPTDGADGASTLPFGQDHTWRLDLSFSQVLWAGGRIRAQTRAATSNLDAAEVGLRSTRASVALDAARAYLDAALAEALVAIADAAVEQSERTLRQTQVGFEVGAQPEFDVLRAHVELDNRRLDAVRAAARRDVAALTLRQRLALPPDLPIELTTPLIRGAVDLDLTADLADVPEDPAARLVIAQAGLIVEGREAQLRAARAQWLPTLVLGAGAGVVAYPEDPIPPLDPDDWRENVDATLALRAPLFTGFRIRGEVRTAKADLADAVARAALTAELSDLDGASTSAELRGARAALFATEGTVDVAKRALAIAEVRFQQGISAQIEVSDARLALEQAMANRAQATRDLLLARITLALLPALPLQSSTPGGASIGAPATGVSTLAPQTSPPIPTSSSAPTTTTTTTTTGTSGAPGPR